MSSPIHKNNQTVTENKIQAAYKEKAIHVSISEEGHENYRKSLLQTEHISTDSKDSYDTIKLSQDAETPDIETNLKVSEQLVDGELGRLTVKDSLESHLQTYATLYDEIQKGYKEGTREVYVADTSSESGYRKLTKEEELESLDKGYEKLITDLDEFHVQNEKNQKIIKEYSEMISKIKGARSETAKNYFENVKTNKENIPENVKERMSLAAQTFRNKYMESTNNSQTVADILSGIDITRYVEK